MVKKFGNLDKCVILKYFCILKNGAKILFVLAINGISWKNEKLWMGCIKAAGDNPAKYLDLLSVTSSSFFRSPV